MAERLPSLAGWLARFLGLGSGLGLVLIAQAQAETAPPAAINGSGLVVLGDAQRGVPMGPLLSQALAPNDSAQVSPLVQFPVRSPGLRPGRLRAGHAARWSDTQWMAHPIFLIGEDARSSRWLRANQGRLAALQAQGMLVEVASVAGFKRLEALADGVPLAPASSPWLTQRLQTLGAAVLPLLILPDGRVTQQVPAGGPARSGAPR